MSDAPRPLTNRELLDEIKSELAATRREVRGIVDRAVEALLARLDLVLDRLDLLCRPAPPSPVADPAPPRRCRRRPRRSC